MQETYFVTSSQFYSRINCFLLDLVILKEDMEEENAADLIKVNLDLVHNKCIVLQATILHVKMYWMKDNVG